MPRLRFDQLSARPSGYQELVVSRPAAAPEGYTPLILLTEWLTLNCRGDWASRARGEEVVVRFADPIDCARASARWLEPFE